MSSSRKSEQALEALAEQLRTEFRNELTNLMNMTKAEIQLQANAQKNSAEEQTRMATNLSEKLDGISTFLANYVKPDSDKQPAPETQDSNSANPNELSRRPALPQPDHFNGDRDKYEFWKYTVREKLRRDGHIIGNNTTDQAGYVIALLQGDASRFVGPLLKHTESITLESLWAHLDRRYDDPYLKEEAWTKLSGLKQGQKPFVDFIQEFNQLLSESGRENMTGKQKVEMLMERISSELSQLAVVGLAWKIREDFTKTSHRLQELDTGYQRSKKRGAYNYPLSGVKSQPRKGGTSSSWLPQTVEAAKIVEGDPMDLDVPAPRVNRVEGGRTRDTRPRPKPISQQELEARKSAGACFNCGRKGCRANQCPYARPQVIGKPRVSNITVGELPAPVMLADQDYEEEYDLANDELKG